MDERSKEGTVEVKTRDTLTSMKPSPHTESPGRILLTVVSDSGPNPKSVGKRRR